MYHKYETAIFRLGFLTALTGCGSVFNTIAYLLCAKSIQLVVVQKPSQSPIRGSHYYWDRKQLIRGILSGLTNCNTWPH